MRKAAFCLFFTVPEILFRPMNSDSRNVITESASSEILLKIMDYFDATARISPAKLYNENINYYQNEL